MDERAILEQMQAPSAPRCPGCGLVMSQREAIEQGACNDCSGGAYDPRDGEKFVEVWNPEDGDTSEPRSYIYRGIE